MTGDGVRQSCNSVTCAESRKALVKDFAFNPPPSMVQSHNRSYRRSHINDGFAGNPALKLSQITTDPYSNHQSPPMHMRKPA